MSIINQTLVKDTEAALRSISVYAEIQEDGSSFLIRGKAMPSKGVYTNQVSFQQMVSKEELEEILKLATIAKHINTYKKKAIAGFGVNSYGTLSLYYGGGEIGKNDFLTLYQKYSMEQPKSTLSLEKNLIRWRRLYGEYQDYYEQVTQKLDFLNTVNTSSLSGVQELMKFAKANRSLWLRIHGYVPTVDKSLLTEYMDIPEMIRQNERIDFVFEEVPIQSREEYAKKVETLEQYTQALIDTFEKELQTLKDIHERIATTLTDIQNANLFTAKDIVIDFSGLEIKTLEEVLNSVPTPKKYVDVRSEQESRFTPDWSKEWAQNLDKEQQANLSQEEKLALAIYKTSLYSPINRIILLMREQNLTFQEVIKTPVCLQIIKDEYDQYKKNYEASTIRLRGMREERGNDSQPMRVYDYLNPDYMTSYETYYKCVIKSIEPLLTAVTKTELTEPLTVYRAAWMDTSQLMKEEQAIGKGLLSTSLSNTFVSQFLDSRGSDIKDKRGKTRVVYKINLPAGTKIAAFTDSILLKYSYDPGFQDSQHEILIDGDTLEYTYEDSSTYQEDGTATKVIEVTAKLKENSYQGQK